MSDKTRAEELFDLGDEQSAAGAKALHEGNTEEGYEGFRQAISAYSAALKEAPEEDLYLRMNLLLSPRPSSGWCSMNCSRPTGCPFSFGRSCSVGSTAGAFQSTGGT